MRMTARHFPVATIFSCLSSSAAKPTKWHIRHVTDNDVQLLSWPRRPRLRRRTMMPYSKTPPASRARRARDSGPRPLQPRHRLRALRSRPAPPAATPPTSPTPRAAPRPAPTPLRARPPLPAQTVLDVGTGSGILAIWAAKAGARKVYAVEATYMADHARTLCAANGVGDIVEARPRACAAPHVSPPRRPSIVCCCCARQVIRTTAEDLELPEKARPPPAACARARTLPRPAAHGPLRPHANRLTDPRRTPPRRTRWTSSSPSGWATSCCASPCWTAC